MDLLWDDWTTKKTPFESSVNGVYDQAPKNDLQLIRMPNKTPITKSYTVIQTMMLSIVIYSVLTALSFPHRDLPGLNPMRSLSP